MPVTLTEKVHEALAARVPPDRLTIEGEPGGLLMVAVIVPLPHEPVTVVEANFVPAGSESLKATPLNAVPVLGLVTVKLKVLLLFSGTLLGLNDLLILGGATTVTSALAVLPAPAVPSLAVTLLFAAPATVPCTLAETVQLAPTGRLELARDTEPDPATAVAEPLHVLFRLLGLATTNVPGAALGRVSVNVIAVRAWFTLFELATVMVKSVVPFSGIVAAPNDFVA